MKTFKEAVDELLVAKTGKTGDELGYREELPDDEEKYDTTMLGEWGQYIGNARIIYICESGIRIFFLSLRPH